MRMKKVPPKKGKGRKRPTEEEGDSEVASETSEVTREEESQSQASHDESDLADVAVESGGDQAKKRRKAVVLTQEQEEKAAELIQVIR